MVLRVEDPKEEKNPQGFFDPFVRVFCDFGGRTLREFAPRT
jgi:hypothetical protein